MSNCWRGKLKLSLRYLSQFVLIGISSIAMIKGAFANPVLNNVSSGNVSVQSSGNTLNVNQSSGQAIINWHSFNINSNETTHFQQPTGGSALNHIDPTQGVSQIYGHLTATGQIILENPAGIYFGPGSYVNVGGLIATTANIRDQDYLNGIYHFTQNPLYNGSIINQGTLIAAANGLIALIGNGVENNGLIQANLGHIVLASGGAFTMSFAGNDLISFSIDAPAYSSGVDENGQPLASNVSNTGNLIADGGHIEVTAQTASGVLDNVIDMQGVTQAQSATLQNGDLVLGDVDINGGSNGVVHVAGNIDASGKASNQKGGNVNITGYNVMLDNNTNIDVSGDVGGG